MGHVHPNLVGATRFEFHIQQCGAGQVLIEAVMGDGWPTIATDDLLASVGGVSTHGLVDGATG